MHKDSDKFSAFCYKRKNVLTRTLRNLMLQIGS